MEEETTLKSEQTTEYVPQELLDAEAKVDAIIQGQIAPDVNTPEIQDLGTHEKEIQIPDEVKKVEEKQVVPEDSKWESRYNVLKGKYDAEVPRLHKQLESQENIISQLTQQNQTLADRISSVEARTQPQPKQPLAEIKRLNPDDFSYIGDEMTELVTGYNALAAALEDRPRGTNADPMLTSRLESLAQKVEFLTGKTQEHEADSFINKIAKEVPDWETINTDPAFVAWLGEPVPYTDKIRHDFLSEAEKAGDAGKCIDFFKDFINVNSNNIPPATKKKSMQDAVMPDSSVSSTGRTEPVKQGVTLAQLTAAAERYRAEPTIVNEKEYDRLSALYQGALRKT